jgi:hypothetical protein
MVGVEVTFGDWVAAGALRLGLQALVMTLTNAMVMMTRAGFDQLTPYQRQGAN